ncbi:LuxR family transcriptional regulator [Desulfovibrio sp. JY]|nr:LuxR family transcriptional regulator [Desulfovibrio sp. JY]
MRHNKSKYFSQISHSDLLVLLEISYECLYCNSEKEYYSIFERIKDILPFDLSTSGLAELDKKSNVIAYELININYPEEWLLLYKEKKFSSVDVIVKNNFTTFQPQYWDHTYKKTQPSRQFLLLASDFNIHHGYTFGSRPFGPCDKASLYSFSGNFKKYDPKIAPILEALIPHLHLASSRLIEAHRIQHNSSILTPREKEVLHWLKNGKSTWEISVILKISAGTVNFHIYNIMKKLDVVNRAQAVAVATHLGVLDID